MGPGDLQTLLHGLPNIQQDNYLLGFHSNDDASVVRLRDDLAIVQSLDFFMPIVDDPYTFGQIAAANSISDIYAMGATPLSALCILGIPLKHLSVEVANQIMLGGAEICRRAGIPILGGHSIDDTEPKFGLSVTGVVHPHEIWYNSGAKSGDVLVLTKPLGIGAMGSANKKELLTAEQYSTFVHITTFLNDVPMKSAQSVGVSAATDVTGFGLLGHAWEMAKGANLSVEIWSDQLPVIEGVWDLLEAGVKPGATKRNLQYLEPMIQIDSNISENEIYLAADPQTSGGLLFAVDPKRVDLLLQQLKEDGALCAEVVGRFVSLEKCTLTLTNKV